MRNILKTTLLLFTSVLIHTVSATNKLANLFLNEDSDSQVNEIDQQRLSKRREQVESNHPGFVEYINKTIENIENYTRMHETQQNNIKKWLTEEYPKLPEFDMEEHRVNILDKCLYVNPNNENQCWECIDGYGPYPINAGNWPCMPCN